MEYDSSSAHLPPSSAHAKRRELVIPTSADESGELRRSLSNRHVQLIAIGGAIGTGLFMGSGRSIHVAGPSIILVYAIVGAVLYFVMRAMGELLLSRSHYASFRDFVEDILGAWAGFAIGWTYWLCWVVLGMADIVAIADYWNFWLHNSFLSLACAVGVLLILLVMNMATVKLFGELEFWFALIKVIAILALVILAIALVVTGFTHEGIQAQFSNIYSYGGFFPHGWKGFIGGFQLAIFAFVGIELVGTTAAETRDPETTLPKAINAIPVRVMIFYVLALASIMMITPWNIVDSEHSPFVSLFSLVGLVGAASIMNFVVLSSASSSCNSGIYSTSRMLYSLARSGQAPKIFMKISRNGVPWVGLVLAVALIIFSLALTTSGSLMNAFTLITTVTSILFIAVWALIIVSYIVYRKRNFERHIRSVYRMPLSGIMPWIILAFFVFILFALAQDPLTARAEAVTPLWFIALAIFWKLRAVKKLSTK